MKILQIKQSLSFLILAICLSMVLMCGYSKEKETAKNKRLTPEQFFSGSHLEMAQAIHRNDREKVEKLLKQGINVNELSEKNTMTYLLYSVMLDNRFEIAELLLKYNADPNKVSKILDDKYEFYYLPLTSVSVNKSIQYMELLLKYGANPNDFYRGKWGIELNAMPAINAAVRSAYILNKWDRKDFMNDIKARIELLLEYGADINSIGAMGLTVVEWAESNPEIVLYLMDKGAAHHIYGKNLLRTSKRLLKATPNNSYRQEIIRRLTALGYE
ncbi:ankyrin repeat domain-containing protein [Gallibacterium anatis]|uniref:Ankyrin repeats (3 copies) n=1 Tax=Gallibacterium anatis TaxID=750 RepID=A0AAX3XEM0_9PAST|nr:hypothetical protein [Gallibacterium anatis]WIM80648.1 hypothetical protein QP018_05305 [Gallibacterium anatis]